DRAHAERNDVHGASAHRATELLRHLFLHGCRWNPVIGWAGILLVFCADKGGGLYARAIRGVRRCKVRLRRLFFFRFDQVAFFNQLATEPVSSSLRAFVKATLSGL